MRCIFADKQKTFLVLTINGIITTIKTRDRTLIRIEFKACRSSST